MKEKIAKALKRLLDLLKRKINEAKRHRRSHRRDKKTKGSSHALVIRQAGIEKSCSWLDGKIGEFLTVINKLNLNSINDEQGKNALKIESDICNEKIKKCDSTEKDKLKKQKEGIEKAIKKLEESSSKDGM